MDLGRLLAETLRRLRRRLGLTQTAMARRVGISQPTLARLEGAAQNTTLKTLQQLCRACRCPIAALFDPDGIDRLAKGARGPLRKAVTRPGIVKRRRL